MHEHFDESAKGTIAENAELTTIECNDINDPNLRHHYQMQILQNNTYASMICIVRISRFIIYSIATLITSFVIC